MKVDERLAQIEAEVQILKDKDEIWRLISRYARAIDEEIDDELTAIFAEDDVPADWDKYTDLNYRLVELAGVTCQRRRLLCWLGIV